MGDQLNGCATHLKFCPTPLGRAKERNAAQIPNPPGGPGFDGAIGIFSWVGPGARSGRLFVTLYRRPDDNFRQSARRGRSPGVWRFVASALEGTVTGNQK